MRLLANSPLLRRFVPVKGEEVTATLWSFSYFFSLLCSYYLLRPVRDEMGIQGGVENLAQLFTVTFATMLATVPLFGWASARFPRARLLPIVYLFFIVNLAIFYALMQAGVAPTVVARAFFVWVSVFNLFVVSVFWMHSAVPASIGKPGSYGSTIWPIAPGFTSSTVTSTP